MSKKIVISIICIFVAILAVVAFMHFKNQNVTNQKNDVIKNDVASVFADYSKSVQAVDFEKMQKAYVDAANQNANGDYNTGASLNIDLQGMEKYLTKDVLDDAQKIGEIISYILYFSPQMGVDTENAFSAQPQDIIINKDASATIPPEAMFVTTKTGSVSQAKASKYSSGTKIMPVSFKKSTDGWMLDFDAIHDALATAS